MTSQDRLHELILRWQEQRDRGRTLTAEELCAQDPGLLAQVNARLVILLSMERFLTEGTQETPTNEGDGTRPAPGAPVASPVVQAPNPATTQELLEQIKSLHLLTADQTKEWEGKPPTSPRQMAGALIQAGLLTPFQINLLMQGRGSELLNGAYVLCQRIGEGGMGRFTRRATGNWARSSPSRSSAKSG